MVRVHIGISRVRGSKLYLLSPLFIVVNSNLSTFYIASTMAGQALLEDVKNSIAEQMKSLPEFGKAESMDFEVWGKVFCEFMVCLFKYRFGIRRLISGIEDEHRRMAEAINSVKADATLNAWIQEAQTAFALFSNEEWLDWGAEILMPQVAVAVMI